MPSSPPSALHSNIDKAVIEHNRAVLPWLRRGAAISHVITINDSNDFDAALPEIRQFWKILTTESGGFGKVDLGWLLFSSLVLKYPRREI